MELGSRVSQIERGSGCATHHELLTELISGWSEPEFKHVLVFGNLFGETPRRAGARGGG